MLQIERQERGENVFLDILMLLICVRDGESETVKWVYPHDEWMSNVWETVTMKEPVGESLTAEC